jgi:enoyl-CoA hydratase/carnithine racemase
MNDDSFIMNGHSVDPGEPRLALSRRGPIALLALSSPPVNALGTGLVRALGAALDQVVADPSVSVLHVRSGLKVFCAGADLAEMRANLADRTTVEAQVAAVRELQALLARLEALPLATVAEMGGAAMGGGLELALACDFRVAASEAKLALPEASLGLVPGAGGTQRLTALCGPAVAKRLILGAEVLDGAAAAALGVVHWAVPRAELGAFADALADRVGALPRSALAAAKSCIAARTSPARNGFEEELAATRELLLHEPETRRRVEAFLARR